MKLLKWNCAKAVPSAPTNLHYHSKMGIHDSWIELTNINRLFMCRTNCQRLDLLQQKLCRIHIPLHFWVGTAKIRQRILGQLLVVKLSKVSMYRSSVFGLLKSIKSVRFLFDSKKLRILYESLHKMLEKKKRAIGHGWSQVGKTKTISHGSFAESAVNRITSWRESGKPFPVMENSKKSIAIQRPFSFHRAPAHGDVCWYSSLRQPAPVYFLFHLPSDSFIKSKLAR